MIKKLLKLPELIFLEIIKFIRDTLQENGIYSSKNTMISQSFVLCALAFIYDIIKNGRVSIEMFDGFLYVAVGTHIIKSASNLIDKKIDTELPEQTPITVTNTTTTIEKKEVE